MKRRFEFRLGRLLRVRAIEERMAQALWSGAEREAALAEGARDALRHRIDRERAELHAAGTLDPRRTLLALDGLDVLTAGLRGRREAALTLRGQAERLAEAWHERERDRRALERLRERRRETHRRELDRREAALADERALTRAFRKAAGPSDEGGGAPPRGRTP